MNASQYTFDYGFTGSAEQTIEYNNVDTEILNMFLIANPKGI